jgi:hypothetical protein
MLNHVRFRWKSLLELTRGLADTCGSELDSYTVVAPTPMLVFGETSRFPCPVAAGRVGPLGVAKRPTAARPGVKAKNGLPPSDSTRPSPRQQK